MSMHTVEPARLKKGNRETVINYQVIEDPQFLCEHCHKRQSSSIEKGVRYRIKEMYFEPISSV